VKPPAKVAVSLTDPPTVIVLADSVVDKVGLALFTVKGSQMLLAPPLFASPE